MCIRLTVMTSKIKLSVLAFIQELVKQNSNAATFKNFFSLSPTVYYIVFLVVARVFILQQQSFDHYKCTLVSRNISTCFTQEQIIWTILYKNMGSQTWSFMKIRIVVDYCCVLVMEMYDRKQGCSMQQFFYVELLYLLKSRVLRCAKIIHCSMAISLMVIIVIAYFVIVVPQRGLRRHHHLHIVCSNNAHTIPFSQLSPYSPHFTHNIVGLLHMVFIILPCKK